MEVHENHGSSITGAVGNGLVKGASVEQYVQINESSFSEQSKSRSAFGTEPMT